MLFNYKRVWARVQETITSKNWRIAEAAKKDIEQQQRDYLKENKETHTPLFFNRIESDNSYHLKKRLKYQGLL